MQIRTGRGWFALTGVAVCAVLLFSGISCSGGGGEGTIEVAGTGVTIELTGPKTVTVKSGEHVTVPAGTYKAKRIQVTANSNRGPVVIQNKGSLGELGEIKVTGGKTTTLKVGQPFTLRARIKETGGFSSKTVGIDLDIVGASGEYYNHEAKRGRSNVYPPQVRIVDRSGRELARGALSYG